VALIVTVAALLATLVMDAVTPVGAEAAVAPAASEYHCTVPGAPVAILAVVTAKVAVPAVPDVMAPVCAPTDTLLVAAALTTSVKAADVVPSIVKVSVEVVPATVEVFPARVKVPELPLIVTFADTETPAGRLATVVV